MSKRSKRRDLKGQLEARKSHKVVYTSYKFSWKHLFKKGEYNGEQRYTIFWLISRAVFRLRRGYVQKFSDLYTDTVLGSIFVELTEEEINDRGKSE